MCCYVFRQNEKFISECDLTKYFEQLHFVGYIYIIQEYRYIHSKCHTSNNTSIRVMDVANCQDANDIDPTLALNAVKIVWTPGLHRPVLDVAIRCLPFDFCSKEDMNGIPLMLQIDSFLENERGIMGTKLINRSFCPIRTFVRYVNNSFFVLRIF